MKPSKRKAARHQVGKSMIATEPTSLGEARRLAIERMLQAGSLTLPELARCLGHSSRVMTAYYLRSVK